MEKNDAHILLSQRRKSRIFIFFFVVSLFWGCKKDQDETKPVITITEPVGFPSYNFNDVVIVKAEISDNENIEWIKYDIIDTNNSNVVAEKNINLSNTVSYSLEATLTIDNIYISTGTHYIRVRAFDGSNISVEFKEIQIYGVPLSTSGIMLTDKLGSYSTTYYMSSDLEINSFLTSSSAIDITEIDPFNQRVMFGNEEDGSIKASDISGYSDNFTSQFLGWISGNYPVFRCSVFLRYSKRLMVGAVNGKMYHLPSNGSGTGSFGSFDLMDGFYANSILETSYAVFIGQKSNIGANKITMHNLGVYNEIQSLLVDFEIQSIHNVSDKIILIGNDDNGGVVAEYFPGWNGLNILSNFNNFDPIISSEVYGSGPNLLISTDAQILRLNLSSSNISTGMTWDISAKQMEYNRASQEMYGLSNDQLFSLTIANSAIETIQVFDNYDLFNIHYNKDPDF